MQVNVVRGGRSAFNAMLCNVPDQSTLNWLSNNINHARDVLGNVVGGLVDASVNLYNKVNGDAVINAAKALVSSQGGHISPYAIYGLDYTNMGTANYTMQQYIMCNPMVQEQYIDNICNGFEETYYDEQPGITGEDRYGYQRVMDGVLYEDGDYMAINHYSNVDDVDIPVSDQFMILETWAHAEVMILNGEDPTEPSEA